MEKIVSSFKVLKRILGMNNRNMEKNNQIRDGLKKDSALTALSHPGGQTMYGRLSHKCRCSGRPCTCGGLEGTLAREEGSTLNNPYTLYTPGRYVRSY